MSIGALPLYSGDFNPPGSSPPGPAGSAPAILTDLATAVQLGIGIYNETQGGPAVQIGGKTPGAPIQPTTIFGFSIAQILVGVVLIVGIFLVVHFTAR